MTLKEMYQYFYYKIYAAMEESFSWWPEGRASSFLLIIQLLLIFAILTFLEILLKKYFIIPQNSFLVLIISFSILIGIIDHFTFHSKDQWKAIVEKYDSWPKSKNRWGTFIVWFIIFIIGVTAAFAVYLMSKGW